MMRPAKVEDTKALCKLLDQLGYASELGQIEKFLSNDNENALSAVYVYELSDKIVGFVSLIRYFYFPARQNVMRVTALCVDAEHRGLGIGSELLSFAENLGRSFGDALVEITCSLEREQSHQFYLKHEYSKHSYKFLKRLTV